MRRTKGGVYWTLTVWRDEKSVRAFMTSGPHLAAMPKLLHWCDEASVAHWEQETSAVSWAEGERRLASEGRLSKVLHPSTAHQSGVVMGSTK